MIIDTRLFALLLGSSKNIGLCHFKERFAGLEGDRDLTTIASINRGIPASIVEVRQGICAISLSTKSLVIDYRRV